MHARTALHTLVALWMSAVLGSTAALAQQVNLRLISGWNPNVSVVPMIESVFIKNVADNSKGEIKIQRSGPEVVPPFEQFQPLAAGVFDFLYTTGGYHQAQSGVANLMDAMKPDPGLRRETGLTDWVDNYYRQRFGVRLIAMIPMPGNHFVLREPLGPDQSLKGRKIRSNPLYDGIVRALGGTPVNMAPTEAFAAMQKSSIDGIAFPAYASTQFKLYEVAKYMTNPIFGATNQVVMMNAKKFDSLSPAQQKVILDEGRRLEVVSMEAFRDFQKRELEVMVKHGVANISFGATGANLDRLYNDGIVATTSKSTPVEVKTLYELAKSKNMVNE